MSAPHKPWNMAALRARSYRARRAVSPIGPKTSLRYSPRRDHTCAHGHVECARCGRAYDPDNERVRDVPRSSVRLTRSDVEFSIDVEQDDIDYRGNVCACSEPDCDAEEEVARRLRRGDVWAWAWVKVTASFHDPRHGLLEVDDSIGGCSYEDRHDFRKNSGYYDDMCEGLVRELCDLIARKDREMMEEEDL